MRGALVAVLAALIVGGCSANGRIARLHAELADDVKQGRQTEAAAVEERIADLASDSFGATTPTTVQIRVSLAESLAQWNETDRALALAESTLAELERLYGRDDERTTPALLSLANIHLAAHQWQAAENTLDRSSVVCHAVYEHTDPAANPFGDCRSDARHRIPAYYLAAGAYRKWSDEYLLSDSLNLGQRDRSEGLSMLTVLGRGYAENGNYPEANWYLQRCVDELRPRYERPVPSSTKAWSTPSHDIEIVVLDGAHSFHSQSPRCLEDLVDIRFKIGDDQGASLLVAWQQNLWARGPDLENTLIERERFADHAWHDDFLTSSYANDLAFYYAGKGRNADCIRLYEEAIALIDRAVARDGAFAGVYPATLHIDELLSLGSAYERAARLTDAVLAYRRAAEIATRELQPRHAWHLEALARLARALSAAGNPHDAEATWRRYLDVAQQIRGRDHADYALGLAGLASALEASGRHAEAVTTRARAASTRANYARRVESVHDLPLPSSLSSSLNSLPSPAN